MNYGVSDLDHAFGFPWTPPVDGRSSGEVPSGAVDVTVSETSGQLSATSGVTVLDPFTPLCELLNRARADRDSMWSAFARSDGLTEVFVTYWAKRSGRFVTDRAVTWRAVPGAATSWRRDVSRAAVEVAAAAESTPDAAREPIAHALYCALVTS